MTTGQFGGFGPQTLTPGQSGRIHHHVQPPHQQHSESFSFSVRHQFRRGDQALENKSLLQILAEPNLIAVNGKEASFLAGGQFPFPIVQPGAGFTAVTISFKEFGVRLQFTPVIMPNGNIHLKVAPEVSTLGFRQRPHDLRIHRSRLEHA